MKHADPNLMNLTNESQATISNDVLHIPSVSHLSPEEIAKAMAHHNKRHHDTADNRTQNTKAGKKPH